jgi:hypothetical protein
MEKDVEVNDINNQGDLIVDDLLKGDWPGLNPDLEPEPVNTDPEPEKVEPAIVDPEPEPEPEPEPVKVEPRVYKYRGKEYTADQLIEQGLLEDALTSAEQMPHYQKKYETLLEQQRAQVEPAAQPQQVQPQQPQVTPEQIMAHYTPVAEAVINEGWIEPEMMTVFPKFTTNMMYFRDLIGKINYAVGVLAAREQQRDVAGTKDRVDSFIKSTCLDLASKAKADPKAKHYEPLGDDAVRDGFVEHLYKLDPKVGDVNEDYIKSQWLAYNSDALLEALSNINSQNQNEIESKRRMAVGESASSPRAASKKKEEPSHIDTLIEGSFPSGG